MQLKVKGKVVYTYSWRRLLYTLCFFFFCLIDQRTKTCSGLDGWLETFRDLTGVIMAVVIMSHYKWSEFVKWKLPYLIWSAVSVVGAVPVYMWGLNNKPFVNDWIVIILDVILYGYIVIHTFISVIIEKKYPKLNKPFAAVWLLMMVLMIVSRSTYLWPFAYLVMFGCFYLTDFTKEEQEDLFQGMLDGIILGFFIMQGLCFAFRPYDEVRYKGIYANPNINAVFYLEVLAAVFTKLVLVTKKTCNKWIRLYYWVGAGVVLSFILLTIGRAAWIAAIVMIGLLLWFLSKLPSPKHWIKNLLALSLCVILTFPLCFGAIRYIPPVFHHPVWMWGEWEETRVHSWDPWDSEKYVDLDEYFETALGRIVKSFEDLLRHAPGGITVHAAEMPAPKKSVLTEEELTDAFLVRSTIYKHYFKNLNLWGHPYEEQGFQIGPYYWIGHAHNIFLQYGTDFGIPMMLVFILLLIWSANTFRKRYKKEQSAVYAGNWLYLLVPALFGLFEYSWGVGSLTILMLFMAWRSMVCDEDAVI